MPQFTLSLVVAGFVALFSCVSGCATYKGQKVRDNAQNQVAPMGIPYLLVRAEYSIGRAAQTEADSKPAYSLALTYETDPAQMYSIKIRPGLFADSSFLTKLYATGALQGTTSMITETISPTITALGSFTTNILGSIAKGALDEADIKSLIAQKLGNNTSAACKAKNNDAIPVIASLGEPAAAPANVADEIKRAFNSYKTDAEFIPSYHYLSEQQRECLSEVLKDFQNQSNDAQKKSNDRWLAERKRYLELNPDDAEYVQTLSAAAQSRDFAKLEALKDQVGVDISSGDSNVVARANARDGLLTLAKTAAVDSASIESTDKLKFFVTMNQATWAARHLAYVEGEITRLELLMLRRPDLRANQGSVFGVSRRIEDLRVERAATIDAGDLYARSLVLNRFLGSIREKITRDGSAPATSEYSTARAELDAVLAQIDARRSKVIANAKPAPPPMTAALIAAPVKRTTQQEIALSKATPGWITNAGKDAAEYVLVLEEVK